MDVEIWEGQGMMGRPRAYRPILGFKWYAAFRYHPNSRNVLLFIKAHCLLPVACKSPQVHCLKGYNDKTCVAKTVYTNLKLVPQENLKDARF